MNKKFQKYINPIRRIFERHLIFNEFIYLVVAVSLFALILLNRSPIFLRPISLYLRTGFNLVVGLYIIILYITFRLKGGIGSLLSLIMTLTLFAFPLAGLWAIGQSQPTIFNGIVPLFDASEYYGDALRLLVGQDLSVFSARRPLFPGLLSFVLWVTKHNLMTTLGVFALATALACFGAVKEIQRTHGNELAVFVLGIIFLFYRYHSGLVMSESLGLLLGSSGFALQWRGTSYRKYTLVWMGLLLFTLALNARAGTLFMLPILLLWFGWVFRSDVQKFSWKHIILGSSAVFLGFVINLIVFRLLASPSGMPFANFSYSLYGLASGGNSWIYVFETHPELLQLQEPNQSREIYKMAFDLILHQPSLLMRGAFYNWSMFLSNTLYGAYSYVGGENKTISIIAQSLMFTLCVLGFIRFLRNPKDLLSGLVCFAALGILVSVPFLPPTDAYRMRPYAASMIVFGLLPGLGMLLIIELWKLPLINNDNVPETHLHLLACLLIVLLTSMLIGPVMIKNTGSLPRFKQVSCEEKLELVSIRFDPGTHFSLVRQNTPGLDWMPTFHISRFRRNSHDMADINMIDWTNSVTPGTSLFYTLDFRSMKNVLMVVPTEKLPVANSLWQACGDREFDPKLLHYNIFYFRTEAREVQ